LGSRNSCPTTYSTPAQLQVEPEEEEEEETEEEEEEEEEEEDPPETGGC